MITTSDIQSAEQLLHALGDQSHGYLFNESASVEGPYLRLRSVSQVNGSTDADDKPMAYISFDPITGDVIAKRAE